MALKRNTLGFLGLAVLMMALGRGCNYKDRNPDSLTSSQQFVSAELNYANVNANVLTPKCTSCHGTQGGINLQSYSAVVSNLALVQSQVIAGAMPKSPVPPLTSNEFNLLMRWINAGAPEFSQPNSPAPGIPPDGNPPLTPTFSAIHQNIFVPKCLACHSAGHSEANIPLAKISDLSPYVVPGNPSGSTLWIITNPSRSSRMPPASSGISALTTEERKTISDWITNGAND